MALVTSKGTMDKETLAVRKYIAQRAELLGAIRLPNNTFKGNAGDVYKRQEMKSVFSLVVFYSMAIVGQSRHLGGHRMKQQQTALHRLMPHSFLSGKLLSESVM